MHHVYMFVTLMYIGMGRPRMDRRERRVAITMSVSPAAADRLEAIARDMGITRSAVIELMIPKFETPRERRVRLAGQGILEPDKE